VENNDVRLRVVGGMPNPPLSTPKQKHWRQIPNLKYGYRTQDKLFVANSRDHFKKILKYELFNTILSESLY
jgi:hypothetical protein